MSGPLASQENVAKFNAAGTALVNPVTGGLLATLGSDIITVGDGGRFPTLKTALEYVITQPAYDVVTGLTGTVTTTQYNDYVVGTGTNFLSKIQAGDLIRISGDGAAPFISSDIKYNITKVSGTDTSLQMSVGFVGAGGAGKTWEIFRPRKYVLLLVSDVNNSDFTADIGLLNGSAAAITALSRRTILKTTNYKVLYPRCGHFTLDNVLLDIEIGGGLFGPNPDSESVPSLAQGFSELQASRIEIRGDTTAGNPINFQGGTVRVENFYSFAFGGALSAQAARYYVNNFFCDTYNATADIVVLASPTVPGKEAWQVGEWHLSNIKMNRDLALTVGAGAMLELTQIAQNKKVYINDFVFVDKNAGSTNCHALILNGDATAKVFAKNIVLDSTGSGYGLGGSIITVYTDNMHNGYGAPVTSDFSTDTIIKMNPGGAVSVAYAATVTPKNNSSEIHNIGVLTGNITVANPTNPQTGQRLVLNYTQDGIGTRTIAYGTAFKATAVGAATANQKGSHSFIYDGTNWVQSGGPVVWL